MRAVILAAGTGSRLGGATTKALVEVNGKKLIDYLFDFIDMDIFDKIYIVGGYHFTELSSYIETFKNNKIVLLENKNFLKGNIFTLLKALDEFDNDSFLITNSDHIYPPVMFDKMEKYFNNITSMCDFDRILGQDDMKIKLFNNSNQIEFIDKKLFDFDCGYIGMTFIHKDNYQLYKNALIETLDKKGDNAVVENILQTLSSNKENAPYICDLSNFGWYEVDDVSDLQKAEMLIKQNNNFKF